MPDESGRAPGPGACIPGTEHSHLWVGIWQLCVSGLCVGQEVSPKPAFEPSLEQYSEN